jgi:hypothetical protein
LIDIVIQRLVSKEVLRLEKLIGNSMPSDDDGNFKNTESGADISKLIL